MRVLLAFKCFFKVLSDTEFAVGVERLAAGALPPPQPEAAPQQAPNAVPAKRSEAITLLAALQREARFVDIVSESLDGYSDAQIGAAARDVLCDCGKVLRRMFDLQPVVDNAEGDTIEVPAGYDTGRYHLTGNISQEPPLTGQLVHSGWQAMRCELPAWTGSNNAAMVVAPAEVQVG